MVDMAADDAVDLAAARFVGHHLLEAADEAYRPLDPDLCPGRERPVGQPEQPPRAGDQPVDDDSKVVGTVAEIGQPAYRVDDPVELIAMDDEEAAAVGSLVQRPVGHDDAAEMGALEIPQELVMVAGDVNDAGALARLPEQLLDHVIVRLRPVPGPPQPPAVDDVADQVDGVRVMVAKEVDQKLCLGRLRAEVEVGQEQRAQASGRRRCGHADLPVAVEAAAFMPRFLQQPYDEAGELQRRCRRR